MACPHCPDQPGERRIRLAQADLDAAVAAANRHIEKGQRQAFASADEEWAVLRFAAWALFALQDAGVIGTPPDDPAAATVAAPPDAPKDPAGAHAG